MKKIMIGSLRLYQKAISPYLGQGKCRYYPNCSEYAKEAVKKYGTAKGTAMAAKRFLRCNPFAKGGYDPVP